MWARAGSWAPAKPHLAAEMEQARAEFRRNREQTICGAIRAFSDPAYGDTETRLRYAPYLVLYLRWEADYPQEWVRPARGCGPRGGPRRGSYASWIATVCPS